MPVAALPPETLRRRVEGADLDFATTDELDDVDEPLGQERAVEALRIAIALDAQGWNAYVLGPPGVGKHALVDAMLARAAVDAPTPNDWVYLNDFADPRRPRAVELPAGRAAELCRDVDRLVDELRVALPAAFEGADHRARVRALEKELEDAREAALGRVQAHAEAKGVALLRTPMGFAFAPTRGGQVLEPDAFRALPEEDQGRIQDDLAALQAELHEVLRGFADLERRHRERVRDANREAARRTAARALEEPRRRWADLPDVLAHLDAVEADVVDNVQELLSAGGAGDGEGDGPGQLRRLLAQAPGLRRYAVNVVVDHSDRAGAPVVYEDLPTHANLLGRIEHHAHFGTLVTDFTLVRPGALHRANGGFLVLDAAKLLVQPFAWEELKRALRAGEIRIEPPERLYGLAGATTLEPAPIPLRVKVVLVGERLLHHLLSQLDPDFSALFKIAADFEDRLRRVPGSDAAYARLVATLARRARLLPLDRGAVVRVIEEASRLAGDAERLTADVAAVSDLLVEADHAARAAGRARVGAEDVGAAIAAADRRAGRIREAILDEIARGTLVVETAGERVGQVNGLSVFEVGRRLFGRPSRITARVRLGRGEVVDIEREVALGGPIHSKGVLILAGYLGARYAGDGPLALAATLVFEQSYGGVEGDSASSAEIYALLSAVSGIPLRQAVAATGSVDQLGRVQAVGAVNEKIEAFFDVCRARGLTGAEGVLLPAANVGHLALREDVVAACAAGSFHVWPVATVDEGIEILAGMPAGERGPGGEFPPGTFNARVAERLAALAARARALAAREEQTARA